MREPTRLEYNAPRRLRFHWHVDCLDDLGGNHDFAGSSAGLIKLVGQFGAASVTLLELIDMEMVAR